MTDDHDDNFDGPVAPDEGQDARDETARREGDEKTVLFDGHRMTGVPQIEPVRLKPDDRFSFSCHRGISCWNECCHGADVTLTPFDIVRLCRNLNVRPAWFLKEFTVPALWEKSGLPVAKLKMTGAAGKGACVFLDEEKGCTVYQDRPATCRYYPLGLAAIKMKGADTKEQFHFLVKEDHCKGHLESKSQTIREFRAEQQIEDYDRHNQGWIDLMMKMASWKTLGGPQGRDVSDQTKQMFFMVSTDVDMFRRFVFESKFLKTYEISDEAVEEIKTSDEALLLLGFDWLKNVLFNEPTIALKEDVLREGIAKSRSELGAG